MKKAITLNGPVNCLIIYQALIQMRKLHVLLTTAHTHRIWVTSHQHVMVARITFLLCLLVIQNHQLVLCYVKDNILIHISQVVPLVWPKLFTTRYCCIHFYWFDGNINHYICRLLNLPMAHQHQQLKLLKMSVRSWDGALSLNMMTAKGW